MMLRCPSATTSDFGALRAPESRRGLLVAPPNTLLQRFPVISDHSVIRYDGEAPSILALAHVFVGEPDRLRRNMR
jgi:hypothetical protein